MGAHVEFVVANWARHLSAQRLLKADVTPRQIRVWVAVVDLVANFSRLEDSVSVARIAATAGVTGNNEHRVGQRVSGDLRRLAELGIITYRAGGSAGRRRSLVGLPVPALHELPPSIQTRHRGTAEGSPDKAERGTRVSASGEPARSRKGNRRWSPVQEKSGLYQEKLPLADIVRMLREEAEEEGEAL